MRNCNSLCNYISNEKPAILSAIMSSIYHVQCAIYNKTCSMKFFQVNSERRRVSNGLSALTLFPFCILYTLYSFLMVLRTIRRPFEVQERVAMELAKGTKALFTFSSGLCLLGTAVQCLIAFKYQKENVKYGHFFGYFPKQQPKERMKIEIGSNISSQGGKGPKKVTK